VKKKRNYHMCMTRTTPIGGADRFRCDYCGAEGMLDDLRQSDCTHVYSVCKACGGDPNSNECRPDCPAILGLLADPKIYVVGTHGPKD
jgi:hypothetical protein